MSILRFAKTGQRHSSSNTKISALFLAFCDFKALINGFLTTRRDLRRPGAKSNNFFTHAVINTKGVQRSLGVSSSEPDLCVCESAERNTLANRETPFAVWERFISTCRAGNWNSAAPVTIYFDAGVRLRWVTQSARCWAWSAFLLFHFVLMFTIATLHPILYVAIYSVNSSSRYWH